jgi:hypothetical protein
VTRRALDDVERHLARDSIRGLRVAKGVWSHLAQQRALNLLECQALVFGETVQRRPQTLVQGRRREVIACAVASLAQMLVCRWSSQPQRRPGAVPPHCDASKSLPRWPRGRARCESLTPERNPCATYSPYRGLPDPIAAPPRRGAQPPG